jgi:hypothetical protein
MGNLRPPVGGINATEYISVLDIDRPEIMDELFERKGDQWYGFFMMIMKAWGFEMPVAQTTYYHYEDDEYIRTMRVGSIVASGQGASQAAFTITLDANDVFTDANSGTHIFPRVGDVFMFPTFTGGVRDKEAIVTAVNPAGPTVTLKFKKAAWTTDTLSVGTNIILVSGAFAEGTGMPDSVIENIRKKSNQTQIIKEAWSGTGTEMTNVKWIKYTSGGQDINAYYAYGQKAMDYRMLYKLDGALMWSNDTDTSPGITDPSGLTTRKVKTTKGLAPWIREEGHTIPYTIGNFNMSKFDVIAKIIDQNRGSDTYMWLHGFDLGTEIKNTLADWLKDSDYSYGTGENIKIKFSSYESNDVKHLFKKQGALSNTASYGATGFEDKQSFAFVMPIGMRKMYRDSNRSESRMAPMFGYRYKSFAGINRRMVLAKWNGISGYQPYTQPVTQLDQNSLFSLADVGFQGMCGNQFMILQGQ